MLRTAAAPATADGWARLWEAIYGRPWPAGARLARELLAAYHDFCRDWEAVYGAPPALDQAAARRLCPE